MKQLNSENLKQIVSGIPKGFTIQVDGKQCTLVQLGVDDDGIYFINFITSVEEEVIKEEHDGCTGCKYEYKGYNEFPCNQCKRDCIDKWEAK